MEVIWMMIRRRNIQSHRGFVLGLGCIYDYLYFVCTIIFGDV